MLGKAYAAVSAGLFLWNIYVQRFQALCNSPHFSLPSNSGGQHIGTEWVVQEALDEADVYVFELAAK
jgi:hypothetical protein